MDRRGPTLVPTGGGPPEVKKPVKEEVLQVMDGPRGSSCPNPVCPFWVCFQAELNTPIPEILSR